MLHHDMAVSHPLPRPRGSAYGRLAVAKVFSLTPQRHLEDVFVAKRGIAGLIIPTYVPATIPWLPSAPLVSLDCLPSPRHLKWSSDNAAYE
jgi:hypothetical protein